jgi:hypothetical protein
MWEHASGGDHQRERFVMMHEINYILCDIPVTVRADSDAYGTTILGVKYRGEDAPIGMITDCQESVEAIREKCDKEYFAMVRDWMLDDEEEKGEE